MKTGFLASGQRTLVMISGGGDSVALLDLAVRLLGHGSVSAVHVNYGRRPAAEADQALCTTLCERLDVTLYVERVSLPTTGNMHDAAREARYAIAEQLADRHDCHTIAVAHTADDQAETILYRLLSSPGRRALVGMPARRGRIVRPLLSTRRDELRDYLRARGLEWQEDESNDDPRFARARVRKLLGETHPAATENLLRTAAELGEEGEALAAVVDELLESAVADGGLNAEALRGMRPAFAALVLREFAERETGLALPAARLRLDEVLAQARAGGTSVVQLEGAELVVEYGIVRVGDAVSAEPAVPREAMLNIPGTVEFGDWRIEALLAADPGDGAAAFDRRSLNGSLIVRTRRPGDRVRPRGFGGSKSLQDLFVDRKVPRRLRDAHPVVCSGDEILWVPGLAVAGGAPSGGVETVVLSGTSASK